GTWPLWLVANEFLYSDRRRLSQVELRREEFIRFTSALTAMPSAKLTASLLSTRGENLCLLRILVEIASDDVGPSEIEHLNIFEVNAAGHPVAIVRFDLDDLDTAYADLDARFEAGEAATYPRSIAALKREALARDDHDWEALAASYHPDLVTTDHRVLGWGTLQGRQAFVEMHSTLFDLAP